MKAGEADGKKIETPFVCSEYGVRKDCGLSTAGTVRTHRHAAVVVVQEQECPGARRALPVTSALRFMASGQQDAQTS